jgi:hypothetical protein
MRRAPAAAVKVLLCKFYYNYIIRVCVPGKIIYQGFTICSNLAIKNVGILRMLRYLVMGQNGG